MAKIAIVAIFILAAFRIGTCAAQDAQKEFKPKKVEVDTNFDGKVDRVEHYDANGQITRVEQDTAGTGKANEWVIYKNGNPVRKEKDTNADGKPDVWIDY